MVKCMLVGELHSSANDGPACELCGLLANMKAKLSEATQLVNNAKAALLEELYSTPLYKDLERARKNYKELEASHFKCAGCGLCFGGLHLAKPTPVIGIGDVCQWCNAEIIKSGKKAFLERTKQVLSGEDDSDE